MTRVMGLMALLLAGCPAPPSSNPPDPQPPVVQPPSPPPPPHDEMAVPDGLMLEGDVLFRPDFVHEIFINLPPSSNSALTTDPREYAPARLVMDGKEFPVEMRLKGSSTFSPLTGKPGMKIRTDQFVPGQEILGHEGFNLHNNNADDSFMGEFLGYYIMRQAGLPAPMSGWATVTIDGDYKGLYLVSQRKDQKWLDAWYDDPTGSLFESVRAEMTDGHCPNNIEQWGCWTLDHAGDNDSRSDLDDMNAGMAQMAPDPYLTVSTWFEMPALINAFALELTLAHWDSYTGNGNNTHIYHEPTTNFWYYTPWSTDLTFGRPVWGSCNTTGTDKDDYQYGDLGEWCQQDQQCNSELNQRILEILDLVDTLDMGTLIDETGAVIQPHIQNEPGLSTSRWADEVNCSRQFMINRRSQLGL